MKLTQLLILIPLAAFTQLSLAHTELAGSTPSADSIIDAAPEELMLHFSEPVRLTAVTIEGDDGQPQRLGPLSTDQTVHFTVASPKLPEGLYTVSWRALSDDTHTMTGEFSFTISNATPADQSMPHGDSDHHNTVATHDDHSAAHE